jgi:hypothetical protein
MKAKLLLFLTWGILESAFAQVGDWPANPAFTYFGATQLPQTNGGYYGVLQDKSAGTTFLNSNDKIHFRISNSDKMILTNSGSFGIGTTSPVGRVDISSAGNQLRLSGGTVAGGVWTNVQDILYLADWNTGTKGLNINMTSGNVGLGVSSPSTKLSFGASVQARLLSLYDQPTDWYGFGIQGYQMRLQVGTANARFSFFAGDNSEVMTVQGSGNVGIGTTSPNQKLTVNGTIYGKEVKVDLNVPGPDYVFEKDYRLPSLDEIKSYVDQHKHLPEVPSAKEMELNGINVSEMNMILLKKVEELTLYLINATNEIKMLNQKVETLSEVKKN